MGESLVDRARRYFSGLFFHPDAEHFGTPAEQGLVYENITFRSGPNLLHGFLLRGVHGRRSGTVLHCHGNAGNVTAHYSLVAFLSRAGYDVLTFDYAGFGRSEGRPTLPGIADDARAALTYLLTRRDLDLNRLAVFGQSLGGAAAAPAAEHPAVRCLVLEATFTTFREMARATFIGRALLPIVPLVIPEGGPAVHLPRFAPRPVLLLHGEADSVVPARFSRRLHRLVPDASRLVVLPDVDHLAVAGDEQSSFAEEILRFLGERFDGTHV